MHPLRVVMTTATFTMRLLRRGIKELADALDRMKRERPPSVDDSHLRDEIEYLRNMLNSRDVNPALIERNKELVDQIDNLKKDLSRQPQPSGGGEESRLRDEISYLRDQLNRRNASTSGGDDNSHLHDEIGHLRNMLRSNNVDPTLIQRNKELSDTVDQLKREISKKDSDPDFAAENKRLKDILKEGNKNNNSHLYDEISHLRDLLHQQNIDPILLDRNKKLADQVDSLQKQLQSSGDNKQLQEEITRLKKLLNSERPGDRLTPEYGDRDRRPSTASAGSSANAELLEEISQLREQLKNQNERPQKELQNEIALLRTMLASDQGVAPAMLERHKQLLDEIMELRSFIAASPDLNPSLVRKNQLLASELERRSESKEDSHLVDEISRLRSLLSSTQDISPALIERNQQLSEQVRKLKKLKNPVFNSSEWLNTELAKLYKGNPITPDEMVKELLRLEATNASLEQKLQSMQTQQPSPGSPPPGVNEALMERNKELALELKRLKSESPKREQSSEQAEATQREIDKLNAEIISLRDLLREQSAKANNQAADDSEIAYLKQQIIALADQLHAAEHSEDEVRDLKRQNADLKEKLEAILQREKSTSKDANDLLDEVARLRLELDKADHDSRQLQDLKIATDQLMQQIHGKADVPSEIKPVTELLHAAQSHQKACRALKEVTDSSGQKSDRSARQLHDEASDLEIECEDLHRDVYKFGWKAAVKLSEDISTLQRKIASQDKEVRKLVAKRTMTTDKTSAMELSANTTDLREDCNYLRELLTENIQASKPQGDKKSQTIKELEARIQQLESDIDQLNRKNRSLEDDNDSLEQKLSKLTKETTDRYTSELHNLQDRVEELQEDNQYLLEQVKEYPAEINELKRKVASLQNANEVLRNPTKMKDIKAAAVHMLWKSSIRYIAVKYFLRWQKVSKVWQSRKRIASALQIGQCRTLAHRCYSSLRSHAALKRMSRVPQSTKSQIKQKIATTLFRTTMRGRASHSFITWLAFTIRKKTDNPDTTMSNYHRSVIADLLGNMTNKGKLQYFFNRLRSFSRRKAQEADTLHWLTILWQTKTQGAMSLLSHHAVRLVRTHYFRWEKYLLWKKKLRSQRTKAECLMMITARGMLRVCYNKLEQYADLTSELRKKEELRNQMLSALFTRSLLAMLRHRYHTWVRFNTLRKEEGFYWRQQSLAANAANTLFVSSVTAFARKYFRRLQSHATSNRQQLKKRSNKHAAETLLSHTARGIATYRYHMWLRYSLMMNQLRKRAAQRRALCECLISRSSHLRLQQAYLRWTRLLSLKSIQRMPSDQRHKLLGCLMKQTANSMRRYCYKHWEQMVIRNRLRDKDNSRRTDSGISHATHVLMSITKRGLTAIYYQKLKDYVKVMKRRRHLLAASNVLLSTTKRGVQSKCYHNLRKYAGVRIHRDIPDHEADRYARSRRRLALSQRLLYQCHRQRLYSAFVKLLTWALRGYQRHHNMIVNASHGINIATGGRPRALSSVKLSSGYY
eukprot:TRINITY_DN1007_c0_g1_i6.p1 TRINITY_DN1007_c0_g1~~TRINITY_DN1007_c0_g1_i6.p1  ORF type:complete len:1499 (+),score=366.15 TRINITY_DN1007_c0_g1_i6:3392-7888(+)